MKTLIFSDSHLSNRFDPKKFAFLKKIVSTADKVIINGDFWEGYTCTFTELVNSPWKQLFPLLKEKNTVYLYGNHDKKSYSDQKTKLFSTTQGIRYKFKSGNKIFHVEHGDRLMPLLDAYLAKYPKFLNDFFETTEGFMFRYFGKLHLYLFFKSLNEKIKKRIADKFKKNEYLVCGHTNFAEIDLERNFINSGFIKHKIGYYLIIEDGDITLHEERY